MQSIFKAYDVRGIYGDELTEDIAYKIGRAFVSLVKYKQVAVGYDMRTSSPNLSRAFMNGVSDQGADPIDVGLVSTDGLYFASGHLNIPGVMFTASHNPSKYNGIKFCKAGAVPINENTGLITMREVIEKNDFAPKPNQPGKTQKKDILNKYVAHVKSFIDVKKISKMRIAVDAGNGMAGKIIPLIYETLPTEIIPLYFDLDGTFPNHPADPSKPENLKELQKKVKEENCDFGMAFDGDADRIFFVDEQGNTVNSSLISSLVIKRLLKPGEKVIYNLVCSKIVPDTIVELGGTPLLERVGHSFIKDTMRKTNAVFACEHSAHYYYRDNYRADSGMITSLIVTEILSTEKKPLSELLKKFKKYHTLDEVSVEVKNKEVTLEKIKNHYQNAKISTLDGVSVEFDDWWFNVRPSNTEPLLRLNLESTSEECMTEKKKEVMSLLVQN